MKVFEVQCLASKQVKENWIIITRKKVNELRNIQDTEFTITRTKYEYISRYRTYPNKLDKFILRFKKKKDRKLFFPPFTEQQFVEFAKMQSYDWLR